jgi:hypothetical protein
MSRPNERWRGTRAERQAEAAAAVEFRDAFTAAATPERLRAMLGDRWLTTSEVLAELGLEPARARSPYIAGILQAAGALRKKRADRSAWTWGASHEACERRADYVPSGPSLMPGRGEKRDCARYGACLTALTRAVPHAERAHCPSGCAYFVEPSRRDALAAAVADVGVANRGAQWGAW